MSTTGAAPLSRTVEYWLYACGFMIFAMAIIGAVTRLTESGLSIVEWRPVTGWIPPLSQDDWERAYALYKKSPEFIKEHHWMGLEDFQRIFFWEWLHRLWGRLIGLAYALPLLWFAVRRRLPAGYGPAFCGILALGGLQGFVGWWMVTSGLIDRPSVSHFRLATHLALALVLFGAIWWLALTLRQKRMGAVLPPTSFCLKRHALIALGLLALTIVWGAFTAGLDAGLVYNSFPLMNGQFTPPETFAPAALLHHHSWVQFAHRWLAVATGLAILALAARTKDAALGMMVFVQVGLGIATLLSHVLLPLAAAHQGGAIILLALLLRRCHILTAARPDAQSP